MLASARARSIESAGYSPKETRCSLPFFLWPRLLMPPSPTTRSFSDQVAEPGPTLTMSPATVPSAKSLRFFGGFFTTARNAASVSLGMLGLTLQSLGLTLGPSFERNGANWRGRLRTTDTLIILFL